MKNRRGKSQLLSFQKSLGTSVLSSCISVECNNVVLVAKRTEAEAMAEALCYTDFGYAPLTRQGGDVTRRLLAERCAVFFLGPNSRVWTTELCRMPCLPSALNMLPWFRWMHRKMASAHHKKATNPSLSIWPMQLQSTHRATCFGAFSSHTTRAATTRRAEHHGFGIIYYPRSAEPPV